MHVLSQTFCQDRKNVIGREGPAEVRQHCSEPTSCSTLRLVPASTLPLPPTHFLKEGSKGWLCTHEQNSVKSLPYIRGMHQINYKRKLIAFCLFFSLSFSFAFFASQSQLQTIHTAGPMGDLRTGDLFFLSFLPFFCPLLLCLGKAKLSYSTLYSVLKFVVGVGSLWKCVVACEPAPLRSLLRELKAY